MRRVAIAFVLLAASFAHAQEITAITGATVVDGRGGEPQIATVLLRGDRIAAIGSAVEIPTGARIIRAEGHALLPGLFDVHTHLPYSAVTGVSGDWAKTLKAYLYCGVTSVVDFGAYPETFEPMRRLVHSGRIPGPRLYLAARITTPDGHGAEGGRSDFFSLEVLTPREARAAVRRVLPYRPDAIKVFTDGWRYGTAPEMTSMEEPTLAAIVEEAHKHGIKVLSHTVTLERAKIAGRAGVDVIAHGISDRPVDQELLRILKSKGTTYAPTLAVYEPRARNLLTPLLQTVMEPLLRMAVKPPLTEPANGNSHAVPAARQRRWQHLLDNTRGLRQAGIPFAVGTDAGVTGTYHGWATLRELSLLVTGGLTPLEAITAATSGAARALGVLDERGTIEPGKLADLILVEGAPHRKIEEMERIRRVFLGGRELDREALAQDIASPLPTPLDAAAVPQKVDDFERPDGRSSLDTLWVNSTDSGHNHTRMIFGRTLRDNGNHALSVMARMAQKDHAYARVNVPLSRGAVEPADASKWKGVHFDVRGEGPYRLLIPTYAVRDGAWRYAFFEAGPRWSTVKIEFFELRSNERGAHVPWTGKDLLMLTFEIERPAGELAWLELDNIQFYR